MKINLYFGAQTSTYKRANTRNGAQTSAHKSGNTRKGAQTSVHKNTNARSRPRMSAHNNTNVWLGAHTCVLCAMLCADILPRDLIPCGFSEPQPCLLLLNFKIPKQSPGQH